MKSLFRTVRRFVPDLACALATLVFVGVSAASVAAEHVGAEVYRPVPMPPGFTVEATELEGPVFADSDGRTLYKWPQHKMRNGYSGEAAGTPACHEDVLAVTAGLMSPYPAGIALPELESRKSCTELWPPMWANKDSEATGKWSVLKRRGGRYQWAYEEHPLYTSILDHRPGDTLGGTRHKRDQDWPATREPVGPPALLPPGFAVKRITVGRLLTSDKNASIYAFSKDTQDSTACTGSCLDSWHPVIAPALARPQGEWSVLERAPGVRQWVFRGAPLYTFEYDRRSWSQEGSDVPDWSNVFTQVAPAPPSAFTVQPTLAGNVLADRHGKSIYIYRCGEDSADQLSCDHPDDSQVYRLAMCGGGDAQRCLQYWPYVLAEDDEESTARSWSIVVIDPVTGRFASAGQAGALRVWAYRDRPVYTFAGDKRPGDVNGAGTGEWRGKRNGLLAFWLRDDFLDGTL